MSDWKYETREIVMSRESMAFDILLKLIEVLGNRQDLSLLMHPRDAVVLADALLAELAKRPPPIPGSIEEYVLKVGPKEAAKKPEP